MLKAINRNKAIRKATIWGPSSHLELDIESMDEAIERVQADQLNTSCGNVESSPISRLKEMEDRNLIGNLSYTMDSRGGFFVVHVRLQRQKQLYEAKGTAPNKRDARQDASQKMLDLLLAQSPSKSPQFSTLPMLAKDCPPVLFRPDPRSSSGSLNTSSASSDSSSYNYCSSNVNPVARLNELAQKRCQRAPVYKDEQRFGQLHQLRFAVSCTLADGRMELGTASSKKAAKTKAAQQMCEALGLRL